MLGLATWGRRVFATVGNKITDLSPAKAFAAQFATATTILIASRIGTAKRQETLGFILPSVVQRHSPPNERLMVLGLPVSTTHTLVGAVAGIGVYSRGLAALRNRMLANILISWAVTIPFSAGLTIGLTYALQALYWATVVV